MTPEEYRAVEKFATSLRECYENALKTYDHDNVVDRAMCQAIRYCRDTLNVHLSLAGVDFEEYARKQEKYFEKVEPGK